MSSTYDKMWAYQIHNKMLHLYEYDEDNAYDAPAESYTNGLKIEYVTGGRVFVDSNGDPDNTAPTETSILNCKDSEIPAVISFVKAKLAEDAGNVDLREYWMSDFHKQRTKALNAERTGPSIMKVQTPTLLDRREQ